MTSARTKAVVLFTVALIAGGLAVMSIGFTQGGPFKANLPEMIVMTAIAAMAPWLANLFPKGEQLRRQAMFLALGVVSYQIGNLLWMYDDVFRGGGTYPGIPDLFFFLGMYGALGAGVWLALFAYLRVYRSAAPFAIAGSVSLVLLAVLWENALRDIATAPDLGSLERALSLAYPLSDVFLLILPSTALIVILIRMGRASFAKPWWPIAAGFWVLALGDVEYGIAEWIGSYRPGTYLDTAWWFASALIVIGLSVMADVHLPNRRS